MTIAICTLESRLSRSLLERLSSVLRLCSSSLIGWRDVDASVRERLVVAHMLGRQRARLLQNLGQDAFTGRGDMHHDQYAGGKIGRQAAHQRLQSLDAACRGTDDHDVAPKRVRVPAHSATRHGAACWLAAHATGLTHAGRCGGRFCRCARPTVRLQGFGPAQAEAPQLDEPRGFGCRSLAVTYSGMACGHTTIGAGRFHFRVRNGIGWFPLAIAARRTGKAFVSTLSRSPMPDRVDPHQLFASSLGNKQTPWGYMVKSHGQLVPVSLAHYCAYTSGLSTT
jgi:hypothetical protein